MRRLTILTMVVALTAWPHAEAGAASEVEAAEPVGQPSISTEPLAIVVNRSSPIEKLTFAELRSIFLGNRSHWANGKRITLVMREPGDGERKTILREVCGMNEDQFKTLFLRGLYTGDILVSPKILSTPTGVRKFIFNVPGAIGYLRASDVDETVKVVRIDELLPGEKGYRLQVPTQPQN
jgi:ABC-type phosphate transport system substrate-binding protein